MRTPKGYLALASLLLTTLLLVPTAAAEWPMEGANPEHNGEQATPLFGAANQWETKVNGELMCPPATAYSKLYLGTSDGYLRVLDESDGHLLWDLELGETICATPLIESQTAIVPSGNTLYAVALTNRSIKWSFEAVGDLVASPVLYDNIVFIGSQDKRLYALDKYTGDLEWSLKLDDVVAASPSVAGLTVVIGTESGTLYGIHRTEGTEEWRTDLGSAVSTAACISQSTALVGTYGGRLCGVDTDDGEIDWTFPHEAEPALDPILTTPVTNSGLVYFGSDGLYCLEVSNGLKVWFHAAGDTVRGSPAIVESYMIFGSYDGIIRCLDKNTGKVVWRYRSDTVFRSGVSIDYDKVFIGGRDGVLYARSILNSKAPVLNGPYTIEAEAHDSVLFEVAANDPEGNILSYSWDFGDGNSSHEANPLHEYPDPGEYTVEVTVSDGSKVKRHTITVIVNPFESQISGGDEATLPIGLIVGVVAAIVVVLLLVFFLVIRRRGGAAEAEEEVPPAEPPTEEPPVSDLVAEVVPVGTETHPPADPYAPPATAVEEEKSWEESQ